VGRIKYGVGRGTLRTDDGRVSSDDVNLSDPPSQIFVEGRTVVLVWPPDKRARFLRLRDALNEFGLHLHETDVPDGSNLRRKWDYRRVDLLTALAHVHDNPGILFDDWAKLWCQGGQQSDAGYKEARKKAMVALSKLFNDGKVEKRKRPEDGRLILYPIGGMPYGELKFAGRPVSA